MTEPRRDTDLGEAARAGGRIASTALLVWGAIVIAIIIAVVVIITTIAD